MVIHEVSKKSGTEYSNTGSISTAAADQLMRHRCAAGSQGGREAIPLHYFGGEEEKTETTRKTEKPGPGL